MEHLTMSELNELGFEVIKSYTHDDYQTQRRKKGCIIIETTWQMPLRNCVSQDLQIEADFVEGFSKKDLKKLDEILNK